MSKLWCFSTDPELTTNMLGWAYIYLTAPCAVKLSITVITCLFCLWFFHYKMGLARQTAAGKGNGADKTTTVPREGGIYACTLFLAKMGVMCMVMMLIPAVFGLLNLDRYPGYLIQFFFSASVFASYVCFWAMVRDEKASNAEKHPLILRVWWVAFFLLITWAVISAVIQYFRGVSQWEPNAFLYSDLWPTFSLSIVYLVIAIRGETGLGVDEDHFSICACHPCAGPRLKESLLPKVSSEEPRERSNAMKAGLSLFLIFIWLGFGILIGRAR